VSAQDHDGSVCVECGGLLDVTFTDTATGATIRKSVCETCGRREERYSK